jgi:hypothetical protein
MPHPKPQRNIAVVVVKLTAAAAVDMPAAADASNPQLLHFAAR